MSNRLAVFGLLIALTSAPSVSAQQPAASPSPLRLGRLANGAVVQFVRSAVGDWGIEIAGGGAVSMVQRQPASVEIYQGGGNAIAASAATAGYQSVRKLADTVVASARVSDGQAVFSVEDRWKISGAVLSLSRKVSVISPENGAGFLSAIPARHSADSGLDRRRLSRPGPALRRAAHP